MGKPEDERSPSGQPILYHKAEEREWSPPAESTGAPEIEQHMAQYFGEASNVFHEIVSELIHLDVHIIRPRAERNHFTLFTTGMSDLPMTPPEEIEDDRWAELMLSLPADWPLDRLQVTPPPSDVEQWYWPIRWLKRLARLPHEYKTWLGMGHTIPNGDPPTPFALGTRLCGWLLLPPVGVPDEAQTVKLSDGRTVNLFVLHALYLEELSLKLNQGVDPLLEAFDRTGVSEVLTLDRKPAVGRKLFGLF